MFVSNGNKHGKKEKNEDEGKKNDNKKVERNMILCVIKQQSRSSISFFSFFSSVVTMRLFHIVHISCFDETKESNLCLKQMCLFGWSFFFFVIVK